MKQLRTITEDEMIAVFLKGEFSSERFGAAIHKQLAVMNQPDSIVAKSDITDNSQNKARRQILSATRGYEQDRVLFVGFPHDVAWQEVEITKDELAHVQYINYSYWNELTNGSRLPSDAAANIRAGKVVFGVSNENFIKAAEAVRAGHQFPTLILVGTDKGSLVALEGHLRLTAYALAWDEVPDAMKVIIGTSRNVGSWGLY